MRDFLGLHHNYVLNPSHGGCYEKINRDFIIAFAN